MGWEGFETKRGEKKPTPRCEHCKKPIRHGLTVHTWCEKYLIHEEIEHALSAPQSKPIKPLEDHRMPKAQAKVSKLPVTPEAVQSAGEEYKTLHSELERITLLLEKAKTFLREYLPKEGILVGNEILYPCLTTTERFDLESAEETLAKKELMVLEPYIKISRSLDLKAASNLIDMKRFRKFIDVRESIQVRFKKLKGEE